MDNKKIYTEFCNSRQDLILFQQPWWLNATCGEQNWDVALVQENNQVVAFWPYYLKGNSLFKYIGMPKLTPSLGPCFLKLPSNYAKSLSRQKQLLFSLVEMLPTHLYSRIKMHYSVANWQPLYWKGYTQTTAYTYVIEDIKDTNEVFKNFQTDIRTEIRKAEKQVTVKDDLNASDFYAVVEKSFARQKKKMSFSRQFLEKVDAACTEKNCRKIFYAIDNNAQIHAAIYVVWDAFSAYYLLGGGDPKLRSSGANSLLLWHAIQYVSPLTTRFDFEGSMLEPVERYVRAFGGRQMPYHIITKATPLTRIGLEMVNLFKG